MNTSYMVQKFVWSPVVPMWLTGAESMTLWSKGYYVRLARESEK